MTKCDKCGYEIHEDNTAKVKVKWPGKLKYKRYLMCLICLYGKRTFDEEY